jgi:uncharacterized radical SAM protein YgiQ
MSFDDLDSKSDVMSDVICDVIYDVIFVIGEPFFDHPLCGCAILKRLLEKNGYSVGVISMPKTENDVCVLGKPRLFFGVTSGAVDSMVRNYTPLKKLRVDDKNVNYNLEVPDRAVIVYSNWIKKFFKSSKIVVGGIEASLRRFVHYDYFQNRLRKPIIFDAKVDVLVYGCAEKQIVEIARRISCGEDLFGVLGTCVISDYVPDDFVLLPSFDSVSGSFDSFCDMQNLFCNDKNLAQKIDNRFLLQFKSPLYFSSDLDEYYELGFLRDVPDCMRGFEFSVVTHRGCIGGCNFCAIKLTQGDKIISRSAESILREVKEITKMKHFKGNIDDLGGPSANMYGMDCSKCGKDCIDCKNLNRSHKKVIELLRQIRSVDRVKNVFVRSGVRYDLCSDKYLSELFRFHVSGRLKIAPEHVCSSVLKLMNKDRGDLGLFLSKYSDNVSFYFMTAHPGSTMECAKELGNFVKKLKFCESVQVFTPTPMSVSTCMYYTGMNPKTRRKVYVPYTFREKKEQKRLVLF